MNRFKTLGGPVLVIAIVSILYSYLPLGTAVEFGGDEGFELMKGSLCSKGYKLYSEIWSDQPPIFSLLLSWGFKQWGASILVARLIAAGFGLVMFASLYRLVSWRLGDWAAVPAVFLLAASPVVLELSVSVMQEVPAFATALVGALLLFQWRDQPHWGWLFASGVVLGVAMGIKLTAAVIVPAMAMEIIIGSTLGQNNSWRRAAVNVFLWSAAAAAAFTVIGLVWGSGSFELAWRAHTTAQRVPGLERPEDLHFPARLLLDHFESVAMAIAGIFLIAAKKRWRDLTFPITFLLTAFLIHAFHRPWWIYYYLHLAIPMAWLAGFGISQLLLIISKYVIESGYHPGSVKAWKGVALCAVVGVTLVRSEGRLHNGMLGLRRRERVGNSPMIAEIKKNASRTHWIYADDGVYAFHAGLLMPPELAVVTLKRFWSGQINTQQIVEICGRYQTEQLLLRQSRIDDRWSNLLAKCSIKTKRGEQILYVNKEIE